MREEFEKLPEIARLIEKRNMIFNEEISRYGALGYADDLSLIDDISFVSGAWYAWQAAKAQTVPKGFVLVPKQPTPKMIDAGHDFCKNNIVTPSGFYKAMIEAQEQNQ